MTLLWCCRPPIHQEFIQKAWILGDIVMEPILYYSYPFQRRHPLYLTEQNCDVHLSQDRGYSLRHEASCSLFLPGGKFPVLRLLRKSGAGGPVLSIVDERRKSSNMIMFNDVRHSEQIPPPTNASVVLCRRLWAFGRHVVHIHGVPFLSCHAWRPISKADRPASTCLSGLGFTD